MKTNFYKLFFTFLFIMISGVGFAQTTVTFEGSGYSPGTANYHGQSLDFPVSGRTLRFNYNNASTTTAPTGEVTSTYYLDNTSSGTNTSLGAFNAGSSDILRISFTDQSLFSFNSLKILDYFGFNLTIRGYRASVLVATATYSGDTNATFSTVNTLTQDANFNNVDEVRITGGSGIYNLFDDVVIQATALAPTITSVTSSTANGSYKTGDVIPVQVNFSTAVTVTGTPQLQLETGTTDRIINYSGTGSGTTTLTFNYTVQAGDNTADLDYLSTTALTLNGGTISASSTNATLTLPAPGATGSLGANKNIVIDTQVPTVSSIVRTSTNPTTVSTPVNYTVTFSEPVTGVDASDFTFTVLPTTLGPAPSVTTVTPVSSTVYTVTLNTGPTSGQFRMDLPASGTGIADLAGNAMTSAFQAGGVYTISAPTSVTGVTSSTANGTYKAGDVISVQVTFSAAVTVTGTPQLQLETGTTDRTINYSGTGSGTTTLTFSYTVQAGDNTADLDYLSTTALTLNGGTISTGSVNAVLTLPAPGAAGSLGANKNIVIDTQVPTVSSIVRTSTNPTTVSTPVNYTVTFSEPVTGVDASDFTFTVLPTTLGPAPSVTTVTPVSSTVYTVTLNTGPTSGQFRMDLPASGTGIADLAGNAMTSAFQAGGVYTISAPTSVTGVTSSTADGTYKTGDVISVQVNFSAAVTVTGTPQLQLETGTTDRTINYSGTGSGTTTLNFNYTVQAGDNTADLDYLSTTALTLNGGTISTGSVNAVLTLPAPGAAGSLSANKDITIDAIAPVAPSTPDLVAASDSGISSTDNLTNVTTPRITGNAEANTTITLYDTDGITVIGSAFVNGAGKWTVNISTPLSQGDHTIKATATDAAGNISVLSSGLLFTIDTTAPTLAITSNVSTLKAGETATITFTFSEDPGTSFTWDGTTGSIVVSGGTLGAITGTGLTRTATFTPTIGQNNGIASITVTAGAYTDAAGNNGGAGTTPALSFDTQLPAAPSTPVLASASDTGIPGDNITKQTRPAFTGTAEANATVILYDTDGTTSLGTIAADGSGNWSITSSALTQGPHTIKATATDAAGNVSVLSSGLVVTIDNTAPTLAITSNVSTLKAGETATITFTFSENPGSSFSLGDITVSGGSLGAVTGTGLTRTVTFTPTAAQNNGTASITVTAGTYTDAAGNNGGAGTTPALSFDTQLPAAPSTPVLAAGSDTGISGDNITSVTTPAFTGTAEAGSTVTLYDTDGTTSLGTIAADGSGNWSITSSALTATSHTITAKATDAAGNISVASAGLTIIIDNTAPNAPSAPVLAAGSDTGVSGDNITSVTTPVFTGTAEPGATVTLYDTNGTTVLGTIAADGSGNWSITSSTLAATSHTITAKAKDAAGNISTVSAGLTIIIDNTAPNAPSTPVLAAGSDTGVSGDNITSITTPVFTGTAEPGATVTLYDTDGITVLGTIAADGSGNWSITSSLLTATSHTITAKAKDASGNISTVSAGLTVIIDTTAPNAPSTPVLAAGSDTGVAGDNITSVTTPAFTGTAEPGATVTLYDTNGTTVLGTIAADGSGNWSITSSLLTATSHTITAKAKDAAGNTSTVSAGLTIIIDSTAPNAPSTPVLAAGSDTGVSGDNITGVTTPVFTGTAEPGATVTLYDTDGTTILGTIAADGSGNWSITSSLLTATSHTITAKAKDAAGNISVASAGLTIIIDNTAPNAPSTPVLAAGSDTGVSGDNITGVTTPVFTGTAEPGATVTLYDTNGTTILGTIAADGSGNWSITSSLLTATSHTITAKAKDASGNISTISAGLTVIIDTTAPNAPSTPVLAAGSDTGVSGDNITGVTTPVFTGTAEPGATVTLYDTDGTTVLGTITADGSGNWSITSSLLTATSHTITAKAKDAAGNTSTLSAGLTIIIDNAAPNAPSTPVLAAGSDTGVSGDNITGVTTPVFTGTAEPGATVTLYDTDGTTILGAIAADGSGNWSITSSLLTATSHTITAKAKDASGNISTVSAGLTVIIDTTAPNAPSAPVLAAGSDTGVSGDNITSVTTPAFIGTAEPGATVTLYDTDGTTVLGTVAADGSGNWSITSSLLTATSHTITAKAKDAAGNISTVSAGLTITIDNTTPNAPSAPVLAAGSDTGISGDNITSVTTPAFTGTAEPGATVTLYDTDGTTVLGTITADGSGNWSITSSTLAAISHTITAKAKDASGNISTVSAGLTIIIDNTAPAAPLVTLPASNATVLVATPAVKGTAEPGSVVTINIDGTVVNTGVTTDGSGNWNYTASALPNGPHTVKALATDVSGNASIYSSTIAFTINVDPTITATGTLSALTTTYGTASSSTSFTVSGVNMTAGVLVTPPAGFEVSTDNTTFTSTVTAGAAGAISQVVYVRLKSTAAANTYSGNNITLSSAGAANVTEPVPTSTVSPLAIAVTADAKSKTYGDADPAFTYTVTTGALVNSDIFTGTLTRNAGEAVNTYAITQGTLALSSNYALTYVPANLTIGTRAITITADAKSKPYATADPELTYTITTGTLSGSDAFTGALVRDAGEAINTYAIKQGTLALSSNYALTYAGASLTITKRTLTITADNQSKVYGSANPTLTVNYSGFVNGESQSNLTSQPVISTDATLSSGVNTYPVTVSGAAIPNYDIIYVPGTLTVTKAVLTATADNKSRNYGVANPQFTVTYSGFVNGDDATRLSAQAVAGSNTIPTSAPGNYPITVNGAASANYSFNYVNGTLTVIPLNGSNVSNLTISAGTLSPAFTSGNHTYTASVDNGSDNVSFTVTFDPTAKVKVNGETAPNGSSSVGVPLNVGNNTITIVVTAQDGVTTNTYTITVYRGEPAAAITATNILTPNGDGKNDTWVIQDIQLYPKNTVTIYDRAGRTVYTKQGYSNDWDGTLKGLPLTQGTYYYTVDLGPGLPKFKGFITLLRSN